MDRNVVTGGRGPAILVTQLDAPTAPEQNVLTRNVANSRLDDGIHVDASALGTVLDRNAAYRNGDDGIEVAASASTSRATPRTATTISGSRP